MLSSPLFKQKVFRLSVIIVIILFVLLGLSGAMRIMAQAESNMSEPSGDVASADSASSDRPMTASQTSSTFPGSSEPNAGAMGIQFMDITPSSVSSAPFPRYWFSVIGSTFQPSSSGYSYAYPGVGCLNPSTGGQWRASVNLPDGSVAKFVYFNYYNSATSAASTVWLTRYQYNGTYQDLLYLVSRPGSTTGAGYYWDLSAEITATINNASNGYAFVWSGSTTQSLCSAQVGYYPPYVMGSALPMVANRP